jgi:predicted PurR-regulated permease PerM
LTTESTRDAVRKAIDIAVTLGLAALILVWCFRIIEPFISLVMWAAVIAVAVHKPFFSLEQRVGGRRSLAVAIFVVIALAIVLVPSVLFIDTLLDSTQSLRTALESGEFHVPAPRESVQGWPLIGESLYASWSEAATSVRDWLSHYKVQVRKVSEVLLGQLAGAGVGVVQFVIASLIAGAFLANAETLQKGTLALFCRLMGKEHAEGMLTLASATVRSVAVGVLGIAFIQAFLGGIGMILAGVPAAGLLALGILVVAIAQLPPWLILLPVTLVVFADHGTTVGVIFAIWSIIVSFADAVLKPILLGRGVEAPMLVILLGAIGGLLLSGIIGLFVGAVVLALGYRLIQVWLAEGDADSVMQHVSPD